MSVKKVCIVSNVTSASPSGVVTYYNHLMTDIPDMEFILITPSEARSLVRKILGGFYMLLKSINHQGLNAVYSIVFYELMLKSALSKKRSSLSNVTFHAQDPISAKACSSIFPNSRIILTSHYNDCPIEEFKLKYNLSDYYVNWLNKYFIKAFENIDLIVGVSKYVIERSSYLMKKDQKCVVIPNAINLDEIKCDIRPKRKDKLIITNCGYFEDRKNQILLIELAKNLITNGVTNFEIWLIGKGPNETLYRTLIKSYQLEKHVLIIGHVQKPWIYISQGHYYIHTAKNDNCPYSILEAMAAGVEIFAIDSGGVKEIVPEGSCFKAEAFIESVSKILIEAFNKGFKEYPETRIKERFTSKFWSREVLKVYNQCM